MRVAFVEQESQMGGVEYTTFRVAQVLDKSKYEPLIICPEEGDLPRLARQAGLTVQIIPRPKFSSVSILWGKRYIANPFGFILTAINVFRAMGILQKHLHTNRVDIVITKGLLAHFYGGLSAHLLNIPCIWYVQEEVDERRAAGLFRLILQQVGKRLPDRIVVDAEALLEQFGVHAANGRNLQVIHNGVDTREFAPFSDRERQDARACLGIPEDSIVIGQAGRLVPLKGQDVLLQAFVDLVDEFPNLHLIFVGAPIFGKSDYEEALHRQAAQSGFGTQVHFTGFLPDVRHGMAAMDIFVHPSVETDSPLSVMEAMACGLPVVVSMVRGTAEMVIPDKDALIFQPDDPNALTVILARLLRDPNMQAQMGAQARKSIMQRFSLQASVSKLETLIEEVYAG